MARPVGLDSPLIFAALQWSSIALSSVFPSHFALVMRSCAYFLETDIEEYLWHETVTQEMFKVRMAISACRVSEGSVYLHQGT
jgi:hypothetical protein